MTLSWIDAKDIQPSQNYISSGARISMNRDENCDFDEIYSNAELNIKSGEYFIIFQISNFPSSSRSSSRCS